MSKPRAVKENPNIVEKKSSSGEDRTWKTRPNAPLPTRPMTLYSDKSRDVVVRWEFASFGAFTEQGGPSSHDGHL